MLLSKKSKKTRKSNALESLASNSNMRIINVLETVKSYYARARNTIHVNAYERAIYQLKKWPHLIKKGNDVAHLEGIGKGMIQKIDTILATGTLPIIQEKNLKRTTKSLLSSSKEYPISQVLGFSEKSAVELEKQYGIRNVRELEELVKSGMPKLKLSRIQQMGLRYHSDLQKKVPREEITQVGHKIAEILEPVGVIVLLAGSYPSGLKKESKDIDILLVVRDSNAIKLQSKPNPKSYLEELVGKLKKDMPLETITIGANKFLGLVKLTDTITNTNRAEDKWRHLDMRLVDMRAFPYAWLYYSSGVIFNKIIREKLKKKGYKLNEWGLFEGNAPVRLEGERTLDELEEIFNNKNNKNKNNKNKNKLMEYAEKIEKEIFKLAQLEYKTIQERY
jgi:DNA polymerase/3'-5' exonuclease PolX